MLDLFDELRALVGALEGAGVEFAMCGGLAMAIHARPRATMAKADMSALARAKPAGR